jgi:hypothetical protein
MAELDGSVLIVHPDRKTQRILARILGSVGRRVVVADGLDAAAVTLRDGVPDVLVVGTDVRCEPRCDDVVDAALAAGCLGCVVVQEDRAALPPRLFEVSSFHHLISAPLAVIVEELWVTVQKLLRRDLFGLDKYLGWGASIGETEIVSTHDRLRALGELTDVVEQMNLGRRQQAAVLLAADELILNAVHNAPVDEHEQPYLRELGRDQARELQGRERPKLRWGCDGRSFAIAVRDAYGSVDPKVIVRYLGKCLATGSGQVRAEGAGAGIGLAMTYAAVTQLVFDVDPGRATEAIALVDVRPWPPAVVPPLASFHLFFSRAV